MKTYSENLSKLRDGLALLLVLFCALKAQAVNNTGSSPDMVNLRCHELPREIAQFQKAQSIVLTNLNSNQRSITSALKELEARNSIPSDSNPETLNKLASVIAAHEAEQNQITKRFNEASNDLMIRIGNCLKNNSTGS